MLLMPTHHVCLMTFVTKQSKLFYHYHLRKKLLEKT